MPPSSQPIITPHMHAHRNKMIATALVLVLMLVLVAFLAFVARKNQHNAAFEQWYTQEQNRIVQENLQQFATLLPEKSEMSQEEISLVAENNVKLFADSLSKDTSTVGTSDTTREALVLFGEQVEEQKELLRKWYFENQ